MDQSHSRPLSVNSDIADYGGRLVNREGDTTYYTYMVDAKKPKGRKKNITTTTSMS